MNDESEKQRAAEAELNAMRNRRIARLEKTIAELTQGAIDNRLPRVAIAVGSGFLPGASKVEYIIDPIYIDTVITLLLAQLSILKEKAGSPSPSNEISA